MGGYKKGLQMRNGVRMSELFQISMLPMSAQIACWSEAELVLIYQHQLATDLTKDLVGGDVIANRTIIEIVSAQDQPIKTYADLLFCMKPPIRLLELVKCFGKAHRESDLSPLPKEISTALYFMSIVVATLRCDDSITTLTSDEIRTGVQWLRQQSWCDSRSFEVLGEYLVRVVA